MEPIEKKLGRIYGDLKFFPREGFPAHFSIKDNGRCEVWVYGDRTLSMLPLGRGLKFCRIGDGCFSGGYFLYNVRIASLRHNLVGQCEYRLLPICVLKGHFFENDLNDFKITEFCFSLDNLLEWFGFKQPSCSMLPNEILKSRESGKVIVSNVDMKQLKFRISEDIIIQVYSDSSLSSNRREGLVLGRRDPLLSFKFSEPKTISESSFEAQRLQYLFAMLMGHIRVKDVCAKIDVDDACDDYEKYIDIFSRWLGDDLETREIVRHEMLFTFAEISTATAGGFEDFYRRYLEFYKSLDFVFPQFVNVCYLQKRRLLNSYDFIVLLNFIEVFYNRKNPEKKCYSMAKKGETLFIENVDEFGKIFDLQKMAYFTGKSAEELTSQGAISNAMIFGKIIVINRGVYAHGDKEKDRSLYYIPLMRLPLFADSVVRAIEILILKEWKLPKSVYERILNRQPFFEIEYI